MFMNNLTSDSKKVQSIRGALYDNGYFPVAVKTGGKSPTESGWTTPRPPGPVNPESLNTGILCNGLRAIDIDCDDAHDAEAIQTVAKQFLGLTATRTRNDSSRVLLLYRAAEGEPGKLKITGEGHTKDHSRAVEVLGSGHQFVAFGTHPKGSEYQWSFPPGEMMGKEYLPAVTEDQVTVFLNEAGAIINASGEIRSSSSHGENIPPDQASLLAPSIQDAQSLIKDMPNQAHGDRTHWISCIAAILGAVGIENRALAEELSLDWCSRFTGTSDEAENLKAVQSIYPPFKAGWAQLLLHAEREGVDVTSWRTIEACSQFQAEDPPAAADNQPRRNRYKLNRFVPADYSKIEPELIEGWFGIEEFSG